MDGRSICSLSLSFNPGCGLRKSPLRSHSLQSLYCASSSSDQPLLSTPSAIQSAVEKAIEVEALKNDPGFLSRERRLARVFYNSVPAQAVVGLCILASFITCIVDSQMLPKEGSSLAQTIRALEILFTIIFAVELLVNLFGNFVRPFFADGMSIS